MFVILDRDGVINFESHAYIKTPDEWKDIPGSIDAISQLTKAGHTLVIATNQSGVNRKLFSLDMLNAIHLKMLRKIEAAGGKIEKIYFCPHTPEDNCDCRKPKTGLFKKIFSDYPVKPKEVIVVGDSLRDLQAGHEMGCQLILVRTGNGNKTEKKLKDFNFSVQIFDDLKAVADHFSILKSK